MGKRGQKKVKKKVVKPKVQIPKFRQTLFAEPKDAHKVPWPPELPLTKRPIGAGKQQELSRHKTAFLVLAHGGEESNKILSFFISGNYRHGKPLFDPVYPTLPVNATPSTIVEIAN